MYQGEIRLSAGDSIAFMNRKSRHSVACAVAEAGWHESIKSVPDAITWANYCQEHGLQDCYTSDNTFRDWRNVTNVKEITRLAVDLDYYNTKYQALEPIELWEIIEKECPWLPKPTIIESSGRGAYLKWKLARPLPINPKTKKFNFLGQWQLCQDFLIDRLKPYGADPKAGDVTRVLRVVGTINSRSLARAEAWTCGPEYEFAKLKEHLNAEFKQSQPRPDKNLLNRTRSLATVDRLFNWHSLAFARLRDIEALAKLRGGRFTEHRRRAIFIYAVELANYCRSEQSLLYELERFVSQFVENPTLYAPSGKRIHLKEVLRRFRMQEERGHWEWFIDESTGRYSKENRYLLKTKTIIDDLCITEQEQRHMKALIGDSEKYRRKVQKRRKNGTKSLEDHFKHRKEQRDRRAMKADKLRSQGMSHRQIAEHFGVSSRTVKNWISI